MKDAAKYFLLRRCMSCFHVQELIGNRCTQCSKLFIGQATEEEKNKTNEKLIKLNRIRLNEGIGEEDEDEN